MRLDPVVRQAWRTWRTSCKRFEAGPARAARVHEFRVATRRLLALMTLLEADRDAAKFRDLTRPAFRAAGKLRDTQVGLRELRGTYRQDPEISALLAYLRQRRRRFVRRLAHRMHDLDIRRARRVLRRFRERLPRGGSAHAILIRRIQQRQAVARDRFVGQWTRATPDVATLHALRVRLKRVRYADEWLELLSPGSVAREVLRQEAALQSRLGAIADLRLQMRLVDRWARRDGRYAAAHRRLQRSLSTAVQRQVRITVRAPLRPASPR